MGASTGARNADVFLKRFSFSLFMGMGVLSARMSMSHVCTMPTEDRRGLLHRLSCQYGESNPGLLEEQPVLLTTEPPIVPS